MAISVLGSVGTGTYASTTHVTTQTIAVTRAIPAGHTIVAMVVTEGAGGVAPNLTLSDAKGNSGPSIVARISGTTRAVSAAYETVVTPLAIGDLVTLTVDVSRFRWAMSLTEVSGLLTSPSDQTASNDAAGASMTAGTTGTTTQASEIVFGGFATGPSDAVTAGSGFTLGDVVFTNLGTNDHRLSVEYQIVSATGAQSATATQATAGNWAGVTFTMKSAVTQTIRPVSDSLTTGYTKVPSGAASFAATVNDQDDTTYTRSGTNPTTGYVEYNIATPSPLPTAGLSANLAARLRGNSFSSATAAVALYVGTTLIKTQTFTLSSSFAEYDVTLSSSDVSNIASADPTWATLKVRVSPVAS